MSGDGLKEDGRQGGLVRVWQYGGPMGLIWPSVPRASYRRQEIRGTSLSHGGTGGRAAAQTGERIYGEEGKKQTAP